MVPALRRVYHRRPTRRYHPATRAEHATLGDASNAVLQPGRASGSTHPGSATPRERWPLMLVPRTPHQPDRPTWDCLACGEPWPCAPGKAELAEQSAVHRPSLRLYLESCMIDMIDDLADGQHVSGRDDAIYNRILGWLNASQPGPASVPSTREGWGCGATSGLTMLMRHYPPAVLVHLPDPQFRRSWRPFWNRLLQPPIPLLFVERQHRRQPGVLRLVRGHPPSPASTPCATPSSGRPVRPCASVRRG